MAKEETKAQLGLLPVLFFVNTLFPEVLTSIPLLPSLEAFSSGVST